MHLLLPADSQELYRNRTGAIFQSAATRKFYLEFQGRIQPFSNLHFNQLKNLLMSVEPAQLLLNHNLCDSEILFVPSMDMLLVMRVHEIIGLKDVFEGAVAMLDLHTILCQRVYSVLI